MLAIRSRYVRVRPVVPSVIAGLSEWRSAFSKIKSARDNSGILNSRNEARSPITAVAFLVRRAELILSDIPPPILLEHFVRRNRQKQSRVPNAVLETVPMPSDELRC